MNPGYARFQRAFALAEQHAGSVRTQGHSSGAWLSYSVCERMNEQIVKTLGFAFPELRHFHVLAKDRRDGSFKPISDFLPKLPPIPTKPRETDPATPTPAFFQTEPRGALSGKTVFLSQSHGWYWHSQLGWITQRPNTNEVVEDFINAETINQYLVEYLSRAGADVWVSRERDMNTGEVIGDNDAQASVDEFAETGAWETGALTGYNGGTYRFSSTSTSETATTTWRLKVPKDGRYAVYVWYLAGDNRAGDAMFKVAHTGGVTVVRVNQQKHGSTWRYLGSFSFRADGPASITLSNQSSESGKVVVADAVRIGGGMGSIARGGSTSGRPRWEEASRYFAEFMGAPPAVYDPLATGEDNSDDVTARPRYSEWEKEPDEDAVFISLHTNAPFPGSGTESYIHNTAPSPGSALLQQAVHTELVSEIRRRWDAAWRDRGMMSANFGEVRLLSTMPGVLIELAFHDTAEPDARYLKEPKFRQLVARAIYRGIVRYFERRDGVGLPLAPEPPTHLAVRNMSGGQVKLSWRPPLIEGAAQALPLRFKVSVSLDGKGFDDGVETGSTSIVFDRLTPGRAYYFRVTAVTEGGESFPSETLAAGVIGVGSSSPLLIVNGFDRLDGSMLIARNESAALGAVKRMFLERMNTFDYVIQHAEAVTAYGVGFDSCSNEAVRDGDALLSGYRAVAWVLGKESVADESFDDVEQSKVAAYLSAGGSLFVSGSEIAYDLDERGGAGDKQFYATFLNAGYAGDNARTRTAQGVGGIFAGVGPFEFGNGSAVYDVTSPDQLRPVGGVVNLQYAGGDGGAAGVEFSGAFKVVNLGFPFETINDASVRAAIMARILRCFGL
jgi:N-acetylmuramoyl-L-alanine amidase